MAHAHKYKLSIKHQILNLTKGITKAVMKEINIKINKGKL